MTEFTVNHAQVLDIVRWIITGLFGVFTGLLGLLFKKLERADERLEERVDELQGIVDNCKMAHYGESRKDMDGLRTEMGAGFQRVHVRIDLLDADIKDILKSLRRLNGG